MRQECVRQGVVHRCLAGSNVLMSSNSVRRCASSYLFRPLIVFAALIIVLLIAALSISCTVQQQMEQTLALGINQMRTDAGLPPLTVDPTLSAIARARAEDMATLNYFTHEPPDGCDSRCMMIQAGISVGWTGEVLGWNDSPADRSASVTISIWQSSAEHYSVITNRCFVRMGTGAAIASDGRIYDVAVFEGWPPGCLP